MGGLCSKKKRKSKKSASGNNSDGDGPDNEDKALNSGDEDEDGDGSGGSNEDKKRSVGGAGGLLAWMTGAGANDGDEEDSKRKKKKKKKRKGDDSDDDDEEARGKRQKRKDRKKRDDAVTLKVLVKSAKGLKDTDWIGHSDPYCIVEIPSKKAKSGKKEVGRTNVCKDSENPVWNQTFMVECSLGDQIDFAVYDEDTFTDELLGRACVDHSSYYPFGYEGEVRLNETGDSRWAFVHVSIQITKAPKSAASPRLGARGNQGGETLAGLNFDENKVAWKKAHAVVNAMEADEALAREETTSTALETLVRLAETGLPIPHEALSRVVACLQSSDRRYRLASLMICKALGRRVKAFAADIAEALADDDEDVRSGAAKVLGTLGDASAPFVTELGNLLQDEVPAVRSGALEALGLLSQTDCLQALVVLGTCLDHQDKRYRLACCLILKALGVKATPHAYSLAERIEQDSSVDVKVAACGALGNIGMGATSVQPALVALYKGEVDQNSRVQQAALQAIEKLQKERRPLPPREGGGNPNADLNKATSPARTPKKPNNSGSNESSTSKSKSSKSSSGLKGGKRVSHAAASNNSAPPPLAPPSDDGMM